MIKGEARVTHTGNVKRILSLAIVAIMIFALVGCGKDEHKIVRLTLSTKDSEAILAAAGIVLPDAETAAGAGTTVKYHHWVDGFHNYSEDEIVNTGYWTFSQKYKGEVEWIQTTYETRFDDLATLIMASTPPDFTTCSVNTFPEKCLKGMFLPVDDYIDYTDPLWSANAEFVDRYFSMNGQSWIICTDVKATDVCAYNRRVISEYGFDDPAELYYNDEWTWDVFYEMCMAFRDPDEDRYALDGWAWQNALVNSTGVTVIAIDEDGKFVSNIDAPQLESVESLIYDLNKNECNSPQVLRGADYDGIGMKEGLTLFWLREKWAFTGPVDEMSNIWGDIAAGEVMFAPIPREAEGDGLYYLGGQPVGYHIVMGAQNPDGVVLLSMCERFKIIDPTVIDVDTRQLKEIYLWSDEMLDMNDECQELAKNNPIVNFAPGCPSQLSTAVNNCIIGTTGDNPSTWAQLKETYREQIDYYLEELNAYVEEGTMT